MKRKNLLLLLLISGSSLLMLVVVSFNAYRNLLSLLEFSKRMDHTSEVLMGAEEVVASLYQGESSVRGYLLTGDFNLVSRFYDAYAQKAATLGQLNRLIDKTNEQHRYLVRLEGMANERFAILQELLIAYGEFPRLDPRVKKLMLQGRVVMDSVRSTVNYIKELENNNLTRMKSYRDQRSSLAPVLLLVFFVFGTVLFLATFIYLIRQIRARQEYEMALEIKVEELKRSNVELESFAYIASHDLQEPLRKIRTMADRLETSFGSQLSEEGVFLTNRIQDNAGRLQELIDDLLQYSRLLNDKDLPPMIPVDLNQVLRMAMDTLEDRIGEKDVLVHLPPPFALPTVMGNQHQLLQVFLNLLGNSLKFTRSGVRPEVTVGCEQVRGADILGARQSDADKLFCRIIISDNGVGFDPAYRDKLFVIFQRLHRQDSFEGTGIGLAICQKIALRHQGYLDANGFPDKGAIFYVYLPFIKLLPSAALS